MYKKKKFEHVSHPNFNEFLFIAVSKERKIRLNGKDQKIK